MSTQENHWSHRSLRLQRCLMQIAALLLVLVSTLNGPAYASSISRQHATFTLDRVTITVSSPLLPGGPFGAADPGNGVQRATAVSYHPYYSFSVEAIPYGRYSEDPGLPQAQAGRVDAYRNALKKVWQGQTQVPQVTPSMIIFGQRVAGTLYHVQMPLDSLAEKPAVVGEWVAEAGSRLWIITIMQEALPQASTANLLNPMQGVALSSTTLSQPTTLASGQANKSSTVHVLLMSL